MNLVDAVESIEPALRRRISAIAISGGPAWTARFSIHAYLPDKRQESEYRDYTFAIDRDNLPNDVSVNVLSRTDDVVRSIDFMPPIVQQIRDLHDAAKLGYLNLAKFDDHSSSPTYIVKTHAGSSAERAAWLAGLDA